jgi:hypothetical protein
MMTTMFILSGLVAVGLIIELVAAARAPLGYQDENGFHFGPERPCGTKEFEYGNPS